MIEEPNWLARFTEHCDAFPDHEEFAFEATLREWRRHHSTPIAVKGEWKRQPAPAIDGIIALAGLRIFAPRSLLCEDRNIKQGGTGSERTPNPANSISA